MFVGKGRSVCVCDFAFVTMKFLWTKNETESTSKLLRTIWISKVKMNDAGIWIKGKSKALTEQQACNIFITLIYVCCCVSVFFSSLLVEHISAPAECWILHQKWIIKWIMYNCFHKAYGWRWRYRAIVIQQSVTGFVLYILIWVSFFFPTLLFTGFSMEFSFSTFARGNSVAFTKL